MLFIKIRSIYFANGLLPESQSLCYTLYIYRMKSNDFEQSTDCTGISSMNKSWSPWRMNEAIYFTRKQVKISWLSALAHTIDLRPSKVSQIQSAQPWERKKTSQRAILMCTLSAAVFRHSAKRVPNLYEILSALALRKIWTILAKAK